MLQKQLQTGSLMIHLRPFLTQENGTFIMCNVLTSHSRRKAPLRSSYNQVLLAQNPVHCKEPFSGYSTQPDLVAILVEGSVLWYMAEREIDFVTRTIKARFTLRILRYGYFEKIFNVDQSSRTLSLKGHYTIKMNICGCFNIIK